MAGDNLFPEHPPHPQRVRRVQGEVPPAPRKVAKVVEIGKVVVHEVQVVVRKVMNPKTHGAIGWAGLGREPAGSGFGVSGFAVGVKEFGFRVFEVLVFDL